MYEFKSYSRDEYSKLIDEIDRDSFQRNAPHFHEEEVRTDELIFITEVEELDIGPRYAVSSKVKKFNFINTVVQR
jgi:hypothetical protein